MTPREDEDEDDDLAPLRPVLSAGFWAAMALGLALVLAGGAVGPWGPKLFHAGRAPAAIQPPRPAPQRSSAL